MVKFSINVNRRVFVMNAVRRFSCLLNIDRAPIVCANNGAKYTVFSGLSSPILWVITVFTTSVFLLRVSSTLSTFGKISLVPICVINAYHS